MLLLMLQEVPLRKSKQEYHKYLSNIVKCILILSLYVITILIFVAKYTNETVIYFYKNVTFLLNFDLHFISKLERNTHMYFTRGGE